MALRNLLFDLGGVILDIDKENCARAFRRIGLTDIGRFLGEYAQAGFFGDLERGDISPAQFRDEIRRYLPEDVTDALIDNAFSAFLLGIPVYRLKALRELRKRFHIYMLSNTNPIMWNGFIAETFRSEGREREDYFDGIVTSFEARSLKPDPAIFRYAEAMLGIDPAETLFFDDSTANCEAAAALGFDTFHVAPGVEFTSCPALRDAALDA